MIDSCFPFPPTPSYHTFPRTHILPLCTLPIHDSKGAVDVISNLKGRFPKLKKIVADGGYRGEFWQIDMIHIREGSRYDSYFDIKDG